MKLYATVNSERASKGQGGNEYLDIRVQDENKIEFLTVRIKPESKSPDGDEQFSVSVHGSIVKRASHWTVKGEKQKGVKDCGTHAKGTCPSDCMYRNY